MSAAIASDQRFRRTTPTPSALFATRTSCTSLQDPVATALTGQTGGLHRDLEEMLEERGGRRPRRRWRLDETYVKVNGQHRYPYRAVDQRGDTIDFLLTARRDCNAARHFLENAIGQNGLPSLINIDKRSANKAAIEACNDSQEGPDIEIRQCKYLNNIVEQDHRNIKRRTRPMLGFKSFWTVRVALGGIELVHMLRKGQLASAPGQTLLSPAEAFYQLAA